jgi:hypothetical protein
MARNKTSANKAEAKTIATYLASHPDKIADVQFVDGEWNVVFAEGLGLGEHIGEELEDTIIEALEMAQDAQDANGEETGLDDDSEDEKGKTIVGHKYRDEYKARGDARSCGDWLAMVLRDLLNGGSKKAPVDLVKTYALARANGCDKEWSHLNPGQQRMNAGNAIRRSVKAQGFLVVPASVSPSGAEETLRP